MKKTHLKYFKNKWFVIGLILVIVIGIIVYSRSRSSGVAIQFTTATIGNVIETVGVTGTISPAERSELSFKKGGVISAVYVKVGDVVYKGQAIASLDSTSERAALLSAEATLADMSRTLTKEELAVQRTALNNAEKDAINTAHDALVKVQSALYNYVDTFFTLPQSTNPTINIRTDNIILENDINRKRLEISTVLQNWDRDVSNAAMMKPADLLSKIQTYLITVKSFMASMSSVITALNPSNSGLSQTALNAYLATVNTAATYTNTAIDAVTQAQTNLASVQSTYNLKLAGNSEQSIAAQAAKVAQARAEVSAGTIVAPFDGIVTKADPHIGEYVVPGQSGFAVQNTDFKIEARVPEADIAKISVGDLATTTLDAYGSSVDFPAEVTQVDPAETIIEGVPTYKVTLHFKNQDSRIRSGMTANLEILTDAKFGVLAVPFRALMDEKGSKVVRLLSSNKKTWTIVPVTVGLKGSSGNIEIVSGLYDGDKVVTYVK